MKQVLYIKVSVFALPDDTEKEILDTFLGFLPFEDLKKEKIKLNQTSAPTKEGKRMRIFDVELDKQRHIKQFIKGFFSRFTDKQRKKLWDQADSRLDDQLNFFVRLDKKGVIKDKYELCDHGNCFHFKFTIAAFPARRETALKVIEELLKGSSE